jgi:thiol:disulfide interchange protein
MKYIRLLSIAFSLVFTFLLNSFLHAETNVSVDAKPSKLSVKKGESFILQLTLNFKGDWYGYGLEEQIGPEGIGPLPTEISVLPDNLIELSGKIKPLDEHSKFDKGFQMKVKYYKGTARFNLPVKAKKDLSFDKQKITVNVNMQLCQGTSCQPPEDYQTIVKNKIFVDVSEKSENNSVGSENQATSDTTNKEILSEQNQNISNTEKERTEQLTKSEISSSLKTNIDKESQEEKPKDLWTIILLGMAAGGAALLTPCVFPMVPITVSFFTKRTEKTKGKGLRDALVYAIGIILTFTGLGFFFSLLFGASGIQNFTNSPGVNIFIAAIFVIFALSMFGAFEIQLPTGLLNKLNAKSMKGSGLGSVVLMGLTFSLASFSCTGPLVGAALISASSGDWFYPIISMLSFSTILALPFFLLALFPGAMSSLPKAGGWMNNIKVVLAFILIAVSLKFINNALYEWNSPISRELYLSIWIGCGLLITLYLIGVFKMSHDTPLEKVTTTRILFVIGFAAITFWLFSGLNGKPMGMIEAFLPAPETEQISEAGLSGISQENQWIEDYSEALKTAQKTGKNLFIDFTGKHCTNCRLMERTVFTKPDVIENMNKMVKVRLITDIKSEPYLTNKKMQLEKFNSVGLPLYVIMTANEKVIATKVFTSDANEFSEFLRKGIK